MRLLVAVVVGVVTFVVGGCSSGESDSSTAPTTLEGATTAPEEGTDLSADVGQLHPEVVDATFSLRSDGTFDIRVTVSSPYDSPDRYADAWRISTLDGEELAVRELAHDHANEQPFTRGLSGVTIPDDVDIVVIDARDQVNGWGEGVEFDLQR